jgi:hypothetical protein
MQMKGKIKLFVAISMLAAAGVVGTGCMSLMVGAGAGAGATAYIKGESIRTYNFPMREMAIAAQMTFSDLDISASETSITEIESNLIGSTSDGSKVAVKLISKGDDITEVRIRVGLIGNETASQRIHDRIFKNLK